MRLVTIERLRASFLSRLPWLALVSFLGFLIFKSEGLVFRWGDANAYWYMADSLRQGVLPYRDFFLADPPLLILWLTPIVWLVGHHLIWLEFWPSLMEAINALVVWRLVQNEFVKRNFSKQLAFWMSQLVVPFYLFSFTILATSDYGTGLQLATFFFWTGQWFWQKNRFLVAGVLLAAACLVKAYMAAAVLGMLAWLVFKKRYSLIFQLAIGGFVITNLVVGPFLLLTGEAMLTDTLWHHLNRPAGLDKIEVMTFLLKREWFWLLVAGAGLFYFRGHHLAWAGVAQLGFFIVFQDVYYAYLGSVMPYLIFFSMLIGGSLWQVGVGQQKNQSSAVGGSSLTEQNSQRLVLMSLILAGAFIMKSVFYYQQRIRPQNTFYQAELVFETVANLDKNWALYGSHEVTPMIALASNRTLWQNYIDTNTQTFASGAQDIEWVSSQAVQDGIYLVTQGLTHPLTDEVVAVYDGYFDKDVFEEACNELIEIQQLQACEQRCVLVFECYRDSL